MFYDETSTSVEMTMKKRDSEDAVAVIDQYELTRELGGGGFGTVYLATDTVSGVPYAVKGLPPLVKNNREELENIRSNFALVSRLTHTNIAHAQVLHLAKDVWYSTEDVRQKLRIERGDTLMVMEYAPGVTLSKWRKQFPDGRVPFAQALEITRQIASALDYAHSMKILHRDIKPANVMIESKTDGGIVARVLDFGLAAEVRSSMSRISREITDTSGTRPYMAPEQWLGVRQGPATDQYALAVLFHELVTGEVPFASVFDTGDPDVMMRVVGRQPFSAPPGLPRFISRPLEKALAKKPEERFASCSAFVSALEKRSGRFDSFAAVAIAVVALVAGAWLIWGGRTKEPPSAPPSPPPARIVVTNEVERIVTKEVERVVTNVVETLPPAAKNVPPIVGKPADAGWEEVQKTINDCRFQIEILRSGAKKYLDDVAPFRTMPGDFAALIAKIDENWNALAGMPAPASIAEAEELKAKASGYAKAISDGLDTLISRRRVYVSNALKNARGYRDGGLWERCAAECDMVLAWDAANDNARKLKAEAEEHLVPTAELTILVEGKPLGAGESVSVGGHAWTTPISWGRGNIAEGKTYEGEVEYFRGEKRYVGTIPSFTVNWRGTKEFAIRLEEFKGSRNGDCRLIELPGGVRMEMVYVDPGMESFAMGNYLRGKEAVPRRVRLTEPYWIGKYPVTQSQWAALARANNVYFANGAPVAWFSPDGGGSDVVGGMDTSDFPMDGISWIDCDALVGALNRNATDGRKYFLPTEAQWEFAARGGTKSRDCTYSGSDDLDEVGWYYGNSGVSRLSDDSRGAVQLAINMCRTHSVGEKNIGNELGIVGMSGNVWEWCSDWYASDYTAISHVADPTGPTSGKTRVLRGGSWRDIARDCRSANRNDSAPGIRERSFGFRLCCSAE